MTAPAIGRPHSDSLSLHVDFRSRPDIQGGCANNRNAVRYRRQWHILKISASSCRAGIEIGRVGSFGCDPATRGAAPASRVPIDDASAVVPGRERTRVLAIYAGIVRTTCVAIAVPR
jgi:hypothetical protein